jgi:hypothetical protein
MSTQYRLVQSGKTASGGCSAGPRFVRAVAPRIIIIIIIINLLQSEWIHAEIFVSKPTGKLLGNLL